MTLTYGIKIIRTWDELPPVVYAEGACFSTRTLEHKYRQMEEALTAIANQGLDASQCRDVAVEALK